MQNPRCGTAQKGAPEVSKVLSQVWSESVLSMFIRGCTRPSSMERGLKTSCLMPARSGQGSVWRPRLSVHLVTSIQGMDRLLIQRKAINGQALADPSLQVTRFYN